MNTHAQLLNVLNETPPPRSRFEMRDPLAHIDWYLRKIDTDMPNFGLRIFEKRSSIDTLTTLEVLTGRILSDDISEETPELLKRLAALTIECVHPCDNPDICDRQWNHSVCHNFESYKAPNWDASKSFLRDPRFFPAAELLVAQAAKIMTKDIIDMPPNYCFLRIINPIIDYNINQMLTNGVTDTFPWKPENLPEIASPLTEEDDLWMIFARSKTPRQFLQIIANEPGVKLSDHEIIVLHELIHKNLGEASADGFLSKPGRKIQALAEAPQGLTSIFTDKAHGILDLLTENVSKGIFCDIEGTLLIDGVINKEIAGYLSKARTQGIPVTLFTGGDAEHLSTILAEQGCDTGLLPVRRKGEYAGQCLEVLIDDTPAAYQPFSACLEVNPTGWSKWGTPSELKKKYGELTRQANSPSPS